ncbi:uncharacterized protein LOC128874266 [Hylaeus volcanicus]|uniref:uncharacterized protein LOC128874266 n=1 Tax=Hylaeus volcanicus TaxID=313075 RepID=UPI0023B83EF2|nr:uncharacterized protein LOC128874266 [Hylaeus volcanicus]XP_053974791.1 uncharacterized protein LOC128874266 [Hylaeus volcanicus]
MYSKLDEYCNLITSSISLARQNILHPQIISPQHLFDVLSNIVLQNGLKWPIPLTYSNMYKYDRLYKLSVAYINNVLVFIIKIPLVKEIQFEFFEMLPLPVLHNIPNTYLYIQPSFPYKLLSTNKVYYAMLQNLEICLTADTNERICAINHIIRTTGQPICETKLLTSNTRGIPPSCRTHTIKGNFERWYYIQNNKWIFTASHPLHLTLTCSSMHIEAVELKSSGIIRLEPQCKGYTETIALEPSFGITANHSHSLIIHKTTEEDCCPKYDENPTITPIRLAPVKITDVNVEEHKHSNHKLIQLDNLLEGELNKPVIVQHNRWSIIALSVIISILALILGIHLLRRCGVLHSTAKCLCPTRNLKSMDDTCCFKIINTNVNADPVTRGQLSKLLKENGPRSTERSLDLLPDYSTDGWHRNDSSTRLIGRHGSRRSTSRAPSIIMD